MIIYYRANDEQDEAVFSQNHWWTGRSQTSFISDFAVLIDYRTIPYHWALLKSNIPYTMVGEPSSTAGEIRDIIAIQLAKVNFEW